MRSYAMVGLTVLAASCLAATAAAQTRTVGLQQALDVPVNLTIEDAPIGEVFTRLSDKTGVAFVVDEQTMACLPYGDQTRLAVRLTNATLRKDLSRMLAPQALQWRIQGETVRIVPSDALARMCRRASYDELQTLGKIYSEQLQSVDKGGPMLNQLRKATGNENLEITFQVRAEENAVFARANKALPGTAAGWLDALCRGEPWTWYLWGNEIIILDRKDQIDRQLQHTVSLRYQNERLVTVLLDLAKKARVTLAMDPGVMNYIPSAVRTNFNLIMADASVAQALEVISGATGLQFIRTEDGLRVAASEELRRRAAELERLRPSPFFVRMNIPGPDGTNIEVYLRADELPDDVAAAIQAEKTKLIERVRAAHPQTREALPAPEENLH
jgi:hypothetical protein